MRLNAYLARAGVTSRRKADELIKAGRVMVNGEAGQLNTDVSPDDRVELDGRAVGAQKLRYILMNKPKGTLSTLKDPHGRKKILDLLSISERVVPVGRLDYDTTGAILLTNDGDLANKLMHPSSEFKKTYIAEVEGQITQEKLDNLQKGVRLEDGISAPAEARQTGKKVELVIHEGRKHQVKRMLAAVGLEVTALHRSAYGPLRVQGLQPGSWRDLSEKEIKALSVVK